MSQVRDKDVKGLIEKLINEYNIIDPQFKPKKPGKIEYPQTLIVLEQDIKEEIIKFLKKEGAEKEDSIQEYIEYFYSIYGLKITFFSSGKILFQGKSTTETDNVFETIKKIITQEHRKEFENKIEQYFDNDEDFSKYIEESECENYISSPGEEYLGKELFNFLNLNDQVDLLDAISLYEFSKKGSIKFNNYAILVRNFAIVFEGFLIKIFIETGILSEQQYKSDVRTAIGNKLSDKVILKYIKHSSHNKHIAASLDSTWQSQRNKNLHSDYISPKIIPEFEEAESDIKQVTKVMKECYYNLDFEKIYDNSGDDNNSKIEVKLSNVDVNQVLINLVNEGFSLKQQKKAKWILQKNNINIVNVNDEYLKVIGPEKEVDNYKKLIESNNSEKERNYSKGIIGIDESGKGDYFGPLVIAGVHINSKQGKLIKELGVKDSKSLSDMQIGLLAQKIKKICEYTIVTIGNEKYNELYSKIDNLNKMLAWGHARAIENMLEKVECNYALSDQFGDEKLIKNALMEKGKNIFLEQRPKAEDNIAVAAASILARNEFISRLKRISRKYDLEFPKGVSNSTVNVGKKFVNLYGRQKLNEVAKIHFKTTKKILK